MHRDRYVVLLSNLILFCFGDLPTLFLFCSFLLFALFYCVLCFTLFFLDSLGFVGRGLFFYYLLASCLQPLQYQNYCVFAMSKRATRQVIFTRSDYVCVQNGETVLLGAWLPLPLGASQRQRCDKRAN